MKKYVIASWVTDFEFPLAEALRKQIWWTALRMRKDFDVEIHIYGSKANKKEIKDDIKIYQYTSSWFNLRNNESNKIDILHFIKGIIGIRDIESIKVNVNTKILTLTDSCIFGEKQIFLRKIISYFIPLLFDEIRVFSNFQLKQLPIKKNVKKCLPFLPEIDKKNIQKYKDPTLLYMGHFSYFKGVDLILDAFEKLLKDYPNLKLILANNGLKGDRNLIQRVKKYKNKYPNNIILKGKIDPIEELSKAWVYLYPFKIPCKTMAFALSLYESQQCSTPFIACDIGANKEFFNKKFLIKPNDLTELIQKIRFFINEQK